jgi:hypothetical protein
LDAIRRSLAESASVPSGNRRRMPESAEHQEESLWILDAGVLEFTVGAGTGRETMNEAVRLAGFLAAHAVKCVSEGKSLTTPLVVVENEEGKTRFVQVEAATSEEAVAKATQFMDDLGSGTVRAVMAFEAYLNLPPGKTDAIFLEARQYAPERQQIFIALPFRLPKSPGGFAVFRPKFIAYEDNAPPLSALSDFFQGAKAHPPGGAIWRKHLDESR